MSTAQFTTPLITVIPGQIIAASLWNNEFINLFTNLDPLGIGAYSDTDAQMQTATDPFPSGTSRPTSMGGELERLRFVLAEITGNTYWYQVPNASIAEIATDIVNLTARFPIQTADIGLLQVTAANIALGTITAAQITNTTITAAQIVNATITETQLATSIAGSGLAGGAGTPLSVNVDGSTIAITGDTLAVPSGGITPTQLSSGVPAAVGLKSIQTLSYLVSFGATGTTVTTNTTISSVNTAKSIAVLATLSISSLGGTTHQTPMITLSLTSPTNLRSVLTVFSNVGGSGDAFNVVVTVLEFN